MRFVTIINSCKSSFQSRASVPGGCCVTQECESASRDSCVRGEKLFLVSLSDPPHVLGITVGTECLVIKSSFEIIKEAKVLPLLHTCGGMIAALLSYL